MKKPLKIYEKKTTRRRRIVKPKRVSSSESSRE